MKIMNGKNPKSWVGCIYGVPGVGKSTLATLAENPVFLDCEGGLDRVECAKYQHDDWPEDRTQIKTWQEFYDATREVYHSDFHTVVIDTISAVQEIMERKILDEVNEGRDEKYKVKTLQDKDAFPYGAGFEALKANWSLFLKIIFSLKEKGKNVLCIGHQNVEKVENPEGENFDRYTLNIHKKSTPMVISKMDCVLFAYYEKALKGKEGSKNKVAVDLGNRMLQTSEKPFCIAKNRFDLPEQIPFTTPEQAKEFFGMIK